MIIQAIPFEDRLIFIAQADLARGTIEMNLGGGWSQFEMHRIGDQIQVGAIRLHQDWIKKLVDEDGR